MQDIKIIKTGALGRITLQRPEVLNSLTPEMLSAIETALSTWENDSDIAAVIIEGEGEKAFCAGGDILKLYKQGMIGNFDYGKKFWSDEYRLNAKIFNYSKPYIAMMQGFTMGGGVGISCHGSHRIVSETSIIAMPECSIGLVPDVGGSYILGQLNNGLGEYLGITGTRMGPADAIYCGFADKFIPIKHWERIIRLISETGEVNEILNKFDEPAPSNGLIELVPSIIEVMSKKDIFSLEERLAKKAKLTFGLSSVRKNSPLSMAATSKMLRIPEISKSIEEALEIEYRFTSRAQETTDFQEGVRAMVIDKDKSPHWKHNSIKDVTERELSALLEPIN